MNLEDLELLQTLSGLPGIAGHEDAVIAWMKDQMSRMGAEVRVDFLGNVIARIPGRSANAPRVMVFAHMDEIGFMVRRIEDNGLLRIERVGGVPEKSLQGQAVMVWGAQRLLPGVIGTRSHHLTPPEERLRIPPFDELYVDVGARDRQEAEQLGIRVGTPITYAPRFYRLAGGRVAGKALDDRAGCWVLLKVLKHILEDPVPPEVFLVATVQEEFHLQGALVAAKAIQPHLAICIDIAAATDTPDLAGKGEIALGKGPVIQTFTFHGRGSLLGLIPNPRLVEAVARIAAQAGIPHQFGVFRGGLTDASYLHLAGSGVPAIDIGIPTRYTHSPLETCSEEDLQHTVALILEWVAALSTLPDLQRGHLVYMTDFKME
ncbi:M42 family metallopeptidase [Thermoflexus sp.]|uniref:M42 family metallopeptidase n=1 Tax=Thermoflexus sp. TaxID=1969742 RepID=UPI002ADD769D|nr:M42 family metallopeptidase [Thermoflexus sp.]